MAAHSLYLDLQLDKYLESCVSDCGSKYYKTACYLKGHLNALQAGWLCDSLVKKMGKIDAMQKDTIEIKQWHFMRSADQNLMLAMSCDDPYIRFIAGQSLIKMYLELVTLQMEAAKYKIVITIPEYRQCYDNIFGNLKKGIFLMGQLLQKPFPLNEKTLPRFLLIYVSLVNICSSLPSTGLITADKFEQLKKMVEAVDQTVTKLNLKEEIKKLNLGVVINADNSIVVTLPGQKA